MNIYLVAHTDVYNPNAVLYGQSELPLTENFTSAFSWIADTLLLDLKSTLYISSPSRRCTKLASFLSGDHFIIDDNFLDINLGNLELSLAEGISENTWTTYMQKGFPEGESLEIVRKRVKKGINSAIKRAQDKTNCIIVCSPILIKLLVLFSLKAPIKSLDLIEINFGSITKLQYLNNIKTVVLSFCNLQPSRYK